MYASSARFRSSSKTRLTLSLLSGRARIAASSCRRRRLMFPSIFPDCSRSARISLSTSIQRGANPLSLSIWLTMRVSCGTKAFSPNSCRFPLPGNFLKSPPFHRHLNLFFNIVGHYVSLNGPLHNSTTRRSGRQFRRIGRTQRKTRKLTAHFRCTIQRVWH